MSVRNPSGAVRRTGAGTMTTTVSVLRDPHAYTSHPWVTQLDNGEWLMAFKQARRMERKFHPTEFPGYHTWLIRSSDRGRTWSVPQVAPGFDWYGTEVPGVVQLRDGTVVLSHFRFAWYPMAEARRRHDEGEEVHLNLPGRGWTDDIAESDWAVSQLPWARGPHGLYVHRSVDRGHVFAETVKIDCSPYHDGYNRTAVVELSDGRLAHPVLEQHVPRPERHFFILFSSTGGRTWDAPVPIMRSGDYISVGEQSLVEVAPGHLLCVIRNTLTTGLLHQSRSSDGGRTWTPPEPTPMLGHPGHLMVLGDGRLLCTYGRREAPYGIRACLSADGGHTWQIDDEIVIRDDMPNDDLGYPVTIEYEPGSLFTVYYGRDTEGVTHLQASYTELST